MKKLILIACVGSFYLVSFAQEKSAGKIPATVKSTFTKNHPKAKEIEWEKEDAFFEVSFEENEVDMSILYDAKGNVKETEKEIKFEELPQAIKDYVAKNLKGKKVSETAKITNDKGISTYEVEVKGKDYLFDSKGNLIK